MKKVESCLVVDDNPGDVELCRHVLSKTGRFPKIYSLENGEDALRLFLQYEESRTTLGNAFPPMLLVLDINMPRMDGFEFLDEYAKIRDRIAAHGSEPSVIVMLTSSSDPRDRERAESYSFVRGFLQKPPSLESAHDLADQFGADGSVK